MLGGRGFFPLRARLGALAVFAMLVAACGSRLPDDVLAEIDANGRRGESAALENDTVAGDDAGAASAAASETGPAAVAGGATGGGGPAGGASTGGAAAASCSGGATDKGVTAREIKVAAMVTASGPLPGRDRGSVPRRRRVLREGERGRRRVRSQDHVAEGRRRAGPAARAERVPAVGAAGVRVRGQPRGGRLGLRRPRRQDEGAVHRHVRRPCGPRAPELAPARGAQRRSLRPVRVPAQVASRRAASRVHVRRRRRCARQHAWCDRRLQEGWLRDRLQLRRAGDAARLHARGHQPSQRASAGAVPVRVRGEHARAARAQHAPAELRAAGEVRQHRVQLEARRAARRHLERVEQPHHAPADAQRRRAGVAARRLPSSSSGTTRPHPARRSTSSPSTAGPRLRSSSKG